VKVRGILDPLAALAPIGDLIADGFSLAGQALSFVYDNLGTEVVEAFGGAVKWVVGWIRYFAGGLYDIADAAGVLDMLAGAIQFVGDLIDSISAESIVGAVNPILASIEGFVNTAIDLYNKANDTPLIGGEDVDEVKLGTLSADALMPLTSPGAGGEGSSGGSSEQPASVTNNNQTYAPTVKVDAAAGTGASQEQRIKIAVENALREERARQGQQRRRESAGN
jgi:hypothetical protein